MGMKETLKQLIDGLMALENQMPESEGEGMELPGNETEIEVKMETEGEDMEGESEDPLMEHMKRALGRNNGSDMASKPMFGGRQEAMPMEKPKMPMQKRFGK